MPVTLDGRTRIEEGVALVSLRLSNTEPIARGVRIANRLDGAVLPPRRRGRPEPGWSAEGFVGVVDAEDELALGYACELQSPDAGAEPPAELVEVSDPADAEPTPMDRAVGGLPGARPPRDAVVAGETGVVGTPTVRSATSELFTEPAGSEPDETRPNDDPGGGPGDTEDGSGDRPAAGIDPPAGDDPAGSLPPAVRRYLADAEARIGRAETFETGSLTEATELLEAGVDPAGLAALVAVDGRALARLADRADALATRAEACDVPVGSMERLA